MSIIQRFLHVARVYGIRYAIIATWRFLTGGTKWVARWDLPTDPRFKFEREWIKLLADNRNMTGAEIGVRDGVHAGYLIDTLDIENLYLIDLYEVYDEYPYVGNNNRMTQYETIAQERLGGLKSTIFIRKYSNDAISDIENCLDFVYIDGNPEYKFVKDDISNYYPLVKEGGVLAGGYHNTPGFQAIKEFSQRNHLEVRSDISNEWFIIKPTTE